MYGIDSGNGYVYGEDESASSAYPSSADCADTCPEQAIEPTMDKTILENT